MMEIDNMFGVEVELEDRSEVIFTDELRESWEFTSDGSLRNGGIEAVLARPMGLQRTLQAIDILKICTTNCSFTDRCGIHVHVDARRWSQRQRMKFVHLYILLERVLFIWEGNKREDNNFCVPLYKNKHSLFYIGTRGHRGLASCTSKYSALNLKSLSEHGSIEIRSMQTTGDFEKLKLLIS